MARQEALQRAATYVQKKRLENALIAHMRFVGIISILILVVVLSVLIKRTRIKLQQTGKTNGKAMAVTLPSWQNRNDCLIRLKGKKQR